MPKGPTILSSTRIRACVAACEGIRTKVLEHIANTDFPQFCFMLVERTAYDEMRRKAEGNCCAEITSCDQCHYADECKEVELA